MAKRKKVILTEEERLEHRRKNNNKYFSSPKGKAAQKKYYDTLFQINLKFNPIGEQDIIDILKAQSSPKNYIKNLIIEANNLRKNND